MPADHTVAPDRSSEPRWNEEDIDAALKAARERADKAGHTDEVYATGYVDGAEHVHRFLINER